MVGKLHIFVSSFTGGFFCSSSIMGTHIIAFVNIAMEAMAHLVRWFVRKR